MSNDGSGVVTITAVADAAVVAKAPDLATDLAFDDVKTAGWSVVGPTAESDGGVRVILSKAFQTPAEASEILANVSGANGPLVGIGLTRQRDGVVATFDLTGSLQITGGLAAYMDEDVLASVGAAPYAAELAAANQQPQSAVAITFVATLPGEVKTTTGVAGSGVTGAVVTSSSVPGSHTLRFTVPTDGSALDITTRSEYRYPSNSWAAPLATGAWILLIVWIVASVVLIGYVVVARRRRALQGVDR